MQERLISIMEHKKSPKTAMVFSVILVAALLTAGIFMSANSIMPSGPDSTMPLESTLLADMDTGLMIRQIMGAINAKSDDIFLGDGPTINLTGDYRWEQTNVFQIFTSINQTRNQAASQPYMRYQIEIQSETMDIEMFAQDGDYVPDARIKLSALLDALKYIPTEHINGFFETPPDKFILRAGTNITYNDEIPRVYYNRYGVTGLSGWFVQLELTPLYGSANSGFAGNAGDVVLLCYGDAPDAVSLPAALPQDEKLEETAPELSRFDALPDTITRDIVAEGLTEPAEETNLGGASVFNVDKQQSKDLFGMSIAIHEYMGAKPPIDRMEMFKYLREFMTSALMYGIPNTDFAS